MSGISSSARDLGFTERRGHVKHLRQSQLGTHRWRVGLGLAFIAICLVLGFFLLKNHNRVIGMIETAGSLGIIGFIVALSIAVILLVPTPIIKIFAGVIFPLHLAVIVNFVGTMIGSLCAFIIGRWLFRDGLVEAIANNSKLQQIDAAIGEKSLRISILVRLSPIIPDEWLNYILAAGPVNLKTFTISNCASIVYCLVYSYYGWAFGQLALKEGGLATLSESSGAVAMLICGLIATLVATVIVTKVTMRALGNAVDEGGVA
ncbi:MAG: VTT domain-containing protein [Candidatus Thalassarchaeaceae archaeon]|nr:VTT domain-containing protein [Candidatus Thalassarchaeaceae archaeon]